MVKNIIFLVLMSVFSFQSYSQNKEPIEIPDSCLYVSNVIAIECSSVYFDDYLFKVHLICPINDFELVVYNRWGEEMYRSNDSSKSWDAGQEKEQVFIWRITGLMDDNGKSVAVKKQGVVTLLK